LRQLAVKCLICGCNSAEGRIGDEIDDDIAPAQKNWIRWNCRYETTYNSSILRERVCKDKTNKGDRNSPNTFTTIEYLLICTECQYQTGYGYLWFAIQEGREHVLSSGHKLVTISEIVWHEDKLLEIIRIDIKSTPGSSSS
jgi:hypothetical protein